RQEPGTAALGVASELLARRRPGKWRGLFYARRCSRLPLTPLLLRLIHLPAATFQRKRAKRASGTGGATAGGPPPQDVRTARRAASLGSDPWPGPRGCPGPARRAQTMLR